MKIVFFGTSQFAVPSLRKLVKSRHDIVLVVTQPDRKKGRHLHLAQSPVKIEAQKLSLPIHQPENASGKDSVNLLRKKQADLFVVVSFGQILKKELLQIPKLYSINLHASVLPKYRGAAPVNWAIINGEETTGVTVIKMNEKMDAGDIILTESANILPDYTSRILDEKLSRLGSEALLRAVALIDEGKVKFTRQDARKVSLAPKLKKENGLIEWKKSEVEIHNLIRGLIPWPGAYSYWNGKTIKIWKTELDSRDFKFSPGQIAEIDPDGIVVKTGRNNIIIKELQLEGGKRMDAAAFLRGHKIKLGDSLHPRGAPL